MALDGSDTSSTIYINSLNPINPSGTDNKAEGDDHIRYIKRVIKNTFPNISGIVNPTHTELNYVDGVTSPIQTQFGTINTSISTINTALANLIPSGTYMLFVQTAAPTGWTKQTTHNDKTLRVVSGTASSGGTIAFSVAFNRTTTDGFGLTASHIPSHTHTLSGNTGTESADHTHTGYTNFAGSHIHSLRDGVGGSETNSITNNSLSGQDYATSFFYSTNIMDWGGNHQHTVQTYGRGTMTHTHAFSGNTGATGNGANPTHAHGMDMRVTYVDVIICQKN